MTKVIAMMSGGIDSPVASWLMIKRGLKTIFVHFHSFPLVSRRSIEKTKKLVKTLVGSRKAKLYLIPFSDIQMYLKTHIPAKKLVILYRRFMLRIAEEIAKRERARAIVTGESLAQVSSQTLDNLLIIESVANIPILRPLIGMDKAEIIRIAKQIGTYSVSIKPQEDCCSLFVPKCATAKAKLADIERMENNLPITKLVKKALKQTELLLL
jgi:thiamine biosynthesis protein ThiI